MQALKALGQNFLIDPSLAERIAALGELNPGDRVWEIGAGKGILTEAILRYDVKLRAFELDRRLPEYLNQQFADRVEFVFADVLQCNWDEYLALDNAPVKLIANIPYQITSPLLSLLERYGSSFSRIVLMLQKEVAQRLSAKPSTKSYAPLTIRLRLKFDISLQLSVGRENFDPQPKVDSAVVLMTPRIDQPVIENPELFNTLLNASFAHRRKTLGNNLISFIGKDKTLILEKRSGIDFQRRGESLEEAEFILLSELLAAL